MKIARVFPRRTKATPDDPLAFTGPPPKGLPDRRQRVACRILKKCMFLWPLPMTWRKRASLPNSG